MINIQDVDACGERFAYGEILAVIDDGEDGGMFVEIKWFLKPKEVQAMRKRR